MIRVKKGLAALLSILLILCLNGCSTINLLTQGEFDASGYVNGILDSTYKGVFDQYIKLTEDTEENAQKAYDAVMEAKAESFANFVSVNLTDETKAKFIEYSKQIYQNAKYEVKDAIKTDNGFTVDIIISPMTIMQSIATEGESFVNDFNDKNSNGDFADLTEEEFEAEYAKGIMQVFDNNISNIQYADPVTITVNVTLQDDKVYSMASDEFTKIDSEMLQQ
ncbi:uncharacterized protein DUF3568 [Lachnotalea glycerini]|uniref:Uncharacterized protein DUF3568 n=1 Tax=Lachnotalea glycerini TaxID=1763509 RepID=A0A318EUU6_9FIRM|nr:hypothetical protein [Lachnotalea glycerini]PXV89103.1 uncharacterized protein DUF3568 [Lachnotalea glycerini]